MPYTDYDEERDGELLIKASALNAAFARYHQKYLQDKVSVMHYKGTVATQADLPSSGNIIGDVYNVTASGENFAWDGTGWDNLGSVVSLSGYATETWVNTQIAAQHDFGTVAVGSTNVVAGSASDTISLVEGSNVTLTPDATNKTVTIAATDTTYSAATASSGGTGGSDGLMSATDKEKLNGIATGAEVNQNAFSSITVGSDTVAADAKTDSFTLTEGSNVTLSVSGDAITIAATDTTYSAATPSASGVGGTDGLMSAADKEKLNGVAAGAEVNQNAFSTVTIGSTDIEADGKTDALTIVAGSNVTLTPDAANDSFTIAATDTTYSVATPDTYSAGVKTADGTAGLMSSADKYKVDTLGTAANGTIASSVTNGGTGLPTEDAVYDFVTDFGYQNSTQVSNAISTALGNELTATQAQDMIDDIWNPPAPSND